MNGFVPKGSRDDPLLAEPKRAPAAMISRRNLILGVALVGLLTATGYTVWRTTDGGGEFVVSGVIEADDVHVGSKVGGRVLKVAAKEGQNVRAGDILVLLEPYELDASLAEAQAL